MLRRSVESLFSSVRKVFYGYDTTRVGRYISSSFGVQFVGACALVTVLQREFPSLCPKRKVVGRKRKRSGPVASTDEHVYENVLLEGITRGKVTAVLFQWLGLPIAEATWNELTIQSPDFREWWAEEREARYPLIPEVEFQIPLVRSREGAFVRSDVL